jgi:hypothetical protein
MSQLLATTSGLGGALFPDDPNNRMRPNFWVRPDIYVRPDDFATVDYYANAYWPGASTLFTEAGALNGDILEPFWWEQPEKISGQSSRLGVIGVTRDVYGSPLGGVTVKLFRTADDTVQDTVTSDANSGAYFITTPWGDAHYIVARKAGSPDVFGATDNDLVGA